MVSEDVSWQLAPMSSWALLVLSYLTDHENCPDVVNAVAFDVPTCWGGSTRHSDAVGRAVEDVPGAVSCSVQREVHLPGEVATGRRTDGCRVVRHPRLRRGHRRR